MEVQGVYAKWLLPGIYNLLSFHKKGGMYYRTCIFYLSHNLKIYI